MSVKNSQLSNILNLLPKWILGIVTLLLPLFFLPIVGMNSETGKFSLLYVAALLGLICFIVAKIIDKKLILPKTSTLVVIKGLSLVLLLSALASASFGRSFFGDGADLGSVLTVFSLLTILFLSFVYVRKEEDIQRLAAIALVPFLITFVYQIIRLFAGNTTLTLGLYAGKYASLLGKWNDLAIWAGLALIICATLYSKAKTRTSKYILIATAILSGIFLLIINFTPVWLTLSLGVLFFIVLSSIQAKSYNFFSGKKKDNKKIALTLAALAILVYTAVSAFALELNSTGALKHPRVYNVAYFVPNVFGGTPAEARPSPTATAYVWKGLLSEYPILGTGPNTFTESWAKYKNVDISKTAFWDTDFSFGFGLIPTIAVSAGILGALAVIAFLIVSLLATIRLFLKSKKNTVSLATALSVAYLLVLSIVYVPSIALMTYLMILLGFVFADQGTHTIDTEVSKLWRIALFVSLLLVLVGGVFICKGLYARYNAQYLYGQSSLALQKQDGLEAAGVAIEKAIEQDPLDTYYRAAAQIQIATITSIIQETNKAAGKINAPLSPQNTRVVQDAFKKAQELSKKAIESNTHNYTNYIFAATVLENDIQLASSTVQLYNESLIYNPYNPTAYLGLARIAAAQNNVTLAKENLAKALELNPRHTESLLASAQISIFEKKNTEALDYLAKAYYSNTSRVEILLDIARLQLVGQKDTTGAIQTLEFAVSANKDYADAKYNLAVLYAGQKRYNEAAGLLSQIIELDSKNRETLEPLIAKLQQNKNPFTETTATKTVKK